MNMAKNTPSSHKNSAAVALAKLGAAKGGRARAANLTPDERQRIARRAAQTRWAKKAVSDQEDVPS